MVRELLLWSKKDLDCTHKLAYPGEEMHTHTPYTQALLNYLQIENTYRTEDLARVLLVEESSMLRKGVITRKGQNLLIILITLEKRADATPYKDYLDGTVLHWEGQTRGKHAERYMMEATHEVFVFIRAQPRMSYTYYGRALPIRSMILPPGQSSKVELHLYEYEQAVEQRFQYQKNSVSDEGKGLYRVDHTETSRLTLTRTAQGQYRKDALKLWNNRCAVTGVAEPKILIASHIKPWRESSNEERVNPRNSLILSPTYDKLFDLGLITFKPNNGKIVLASSIATADWEKLKVDDSKELYMIPDGTEHYLSYHNRHIFGFKPGKMTEEELLIV